MWKLINRSASSEYEEQPEDDLLGGTEGLCSLSPLQRLYGFAACLAAGLVCVFLSLIVFVKPIKFALLFTFGNVLAIGSTTFLIGPQQQLRMMLDPVRVYATAIYAGCVVVALICALLVSHGIN
ncbi:vesicle transport SFT2B [Olea europaea subsp. europaea]|uniref:Vesicle transport protein n=1 Tax=Olea europaea subsp. europaea TaxID=158383 RepID=A0A8S0T2R1_OLEEU|nr:vesicle transport SFT2B [Olea europaea subsp. europaea]